MAEDEVDQVTDDVEDLDLGMDKKKKKTKKPKDDEVTRAQPWQKTKWIR